LQKCIKTKDVSTFRMTYEKRGKGGAVIVNQTPTIEDSDLGPAGHKLCEG